MTIVAKLKEKAAFVQGAIGLVATIGGAVLYFETTYAHAGDVKEILITQQQVIKNQNTSQRQMLMFQIEYYDDRVKRLLAERTQAETRRPGARSLAEVISDLEDTKQRRDMARAAISAQ